MFRKGFMTIIASAVTAALTALAVLAAGVPGPAAAAPRPPHARHAMLVPRSGGVPGSLVYVCTAAPCQNGQEFAVYDPWGNPLWNISDQGLIGSEGLCSTITTLNDYTHLAATMCWGSPAAFAAWSGIPVTTCKAPGAWFEPAGIWSCFAGVWVKKVSW